MSFVVIVVNFHIALVTVFAVGMAFAWILNAVVMVIQIVGTNQMRTDALVSLPLPRLVHLKSFNVPIQCASPYIIDVINFRIVTMVQMKLDVLQRNAKIMNSTVKMALVFLNQRDVMVEEIALMV
ncbi:hypothetical protein ILUMI_03265 [Ignelater luminosus]|uniref:Uncharacterized protein n=1 Tax=Ignelater luminosus TaxID=2038154 RepID=A0A8K0GIH7_IGNLU|nr:hypothetical protein ILUMI_03265 [Ignelater luminosus]